MPELPEVESVLRCLTEQQPSLIGRQVQKVQILRDSVVSGDREFFINTLSGARCTNIFRHGKYLLFGFQHFRATNPPWMALHLRMTGKLFLVSHLQAFERHTRFVLHLDQELALRFDDPRAFGRVWLVDDPAEVTAGLGPDALMIDQNQFVERLSEHRRQLKPLLLDQGFVAGVGNIYADETLFRAGLHPALRSDSLSSDQRKALYDALHNVMKQAVAAKGANIDGVFEAGSFPVAVYGREGALCSRCGSIIQKIRLGQRGTHFCPICQPLH